MKDLINCGFHKIQKLGRVAIGKETMESNELKDGDTVEVFIKKTNQKV